MKKKKQLFRWIFAIGIVLCLVSLVLRFRNEITLERIVHFTPKSRWAAALVMLCLFAIKSFSVFIYGGILYTASGILFPLPIAVLVNILGSILMAFIPYWIGRKAGQEKLTELVQKYPKLELIQIAPKRNAFLFSMLLRIIGMVPNNILGIYMGSTGILPKPYVCGAVIGMLPAVLSFSIMGMSAADRTSPAFLISLAAEILLILISLIGCYIWNRKGNMKNEK